MEKIATIKGEPIIDVYESFDGSYWYIVKKLYTQDSFIDGKVYKNDQILYGYARLSMCPEYAEFGNISEAEFNLLGNRIWKVPKSNWHLCPEVEEKEVSDLSEGEIPSVLIFSSLMKGGHKKMKFENEELDRETIKKLQNHGIWVSRNAPPMNKEKALVLIGEAMLDKFVKEFVHLWKDELFPHCLLRDYNAPEEIREMLDIEEECKEEQESREGEKLKVYENDIF